MKLLHRLDRIEPWKDPLYKNSFFLASSRVFSVICGFFFWVIAAKYYTVEEVGVGVALISLLGIVVLFSRFGFDLSLIRFFPLMDKSSVLSTCLSITTITTVFTGFFYIAITHFIYPEKSLLNDLSYQAVFVTFAVTNSVALIAGNAFIAMRQSEQYLLQNLIMAIRIPLLVPLAFLGCAGIFYATGLAYLLASCMALFVLERSLGLNSRIDRLFIRTSLKFSSANYISNLFAALPVLLLPMMILDTLGEVECAKYYIAFAVGNVVLIIPETISTSLLVEGSYGGRLRSSALKACLAVYACLIPAAVAVYLFGGILLNIFGEEYIETLELLRMLTVSSILAATYYLFVPIQNIRMNVNSIVVLNVLRLIFLLGLSYLTLPSLGILGVGYAWALTYALLSILILVVILKDGLLKGVMNIG